MSPIIRIFQSSLCFLLVATLFGCTTAPMDATDSQLELPYSPQLRPEIATFDAAREDLAALMNDGKKGHRINFGPEYHARYGTADKLVWKEEPSELMRGVQEWNGYSCNAAHELIQIDLKSMVVLEDGLRAGPRIFISYDTDMYELPTSVVSAGDRYAVGDPQFISFDFQEPDRARRFADDLCFMQQWMRKQEEPRLALFGTKAAEYRALAVKPPVTEEQRKYIVQANALNEEKDYAGAIALYLKALDLDPVSYPGAYFNLGLLSAQMKRYNAAITYMKQYLLLVPEAPDARSAQDKIYEWELKMK
jgi:tetratricopeptide (TPR) repeat protein